MNSNYSRSLTAMEQYADIMDRLAAALRSGQEALVRMDLPAFEQLTAEQETLCARLKELRAASDRGADSRDEIPVGPTPEFLQSEFDRQRAILKRRCLALQERVRHLNRVNHFFLYRARQSFELLLRLAALTQGTYSPQASVLSECPARRE